MRHKANDGVGLVDVIRAW